MCFVCTFVKTLEGHISDGAVLFETYFLLNSPLFSSFLLISVLILEINLAQRRTIVKQVS